MGGKSSRTKGHNFERWVARAFQVVYPEARRGLQYRDPRECDVEGTPFRIECKRLAKVAMADINAAIFQVVRDGEAHDDDRIPVVIVKADRREPGVYLTLDGFLSLIERHFWQPTEDRDIIPFPTKEQR